MTCLHCHHGLCVNECSHAEGIEWIGVRCVNCGWRSCGVLKRPRPNEVDADRHVTLWPLEDKQTWTH
jgi:hypothetical protein